MYTVTAKDKAATQDDWLPGNFVTVSRNEHTIHGYINCQHLQETEVAIEDVQERLERAWHVQFVYYSKHISKEQTRDPKSSYESLYWKFGKIQEDGIPFCVMKSIIKACKYGRRVYKKDKSEILQNKKRRLTKSKKCGCDAKLWIKIIRRYDEFSLPAGSSRWQKEKKLYEFKMRKTPTVVTYRVHFWVPLKHSSHNVESSSGSDKNLNVHVKHKIRELVMGGIRSPFTLRSLLKQYVEEDLCGDSNIKPSLTDAAYYPSVKNIRNHVRLTLRKRYVKTNKNRLQDLSANSEVRETDSEISVNVLLQPCVDGNTQQINASASEDVVIPEYTGMQTQVINTTEYTATVDNAGAMAQLADAAACNDGARRNISQSAAASAAANVSTDTTSCNDASQLTAAQKTFHCLCRSLARTASHITDPAKLSKHIRALELMLYDTDNSIPSGIMLGPYAHRMTKTAPTKSSSDGISVVGGLTQGIEQQTVAQPSTVEIEMAQYQVKYEHNY